LATLAKQVVEEIEPEPHRDLHLRPVRLIERM
jgi:hypothetical protein